MEFEKAATAGKVCEEVLASVYDHTDPDISSWTYYKDIPVKELTREEKISEILCGVKRRNGQVPPLCILQHPSVSCPLNKRP